MFALLHQFWGLLLLVGLGLFTVSFVSFWDNSYQDNAEASRWYISMQLGQSESPIPPVLKSNAVPILLGIIAIFCLAASLVGLVVR